VKKTVLIIPYSKINSYRKLYKDKKTVLVGGCFDLIHYGHLQFLKKAEETGEFLIVVLESDDFNKREIPIHSQKERAEVLSSLNIVDLVVLLPYFRSNREYFEMVREVKPKIIAVTEEDPQLQNKKRQIKAIGGQLKIVTPLLKKFSTRRIINKFNL
jgi:cytidyltransferase-like protein